MCCECVDELMVAALPAASSPRTGVSDGSEGLYLTLRATRNSVGKQEGKAL